MHNYIQDSMWPYVVIMGVYVGLAIWTGLLLNLYRKSNKTNVTINTATRYENEKVVVYIKKSQQEVRDGKALSGDLDALAKRFDR